MFLITLSPTHTDTHSHAFSVIVSGNQVCQIGAYLPVVTWPRCRSVLFQNNGRVNERYSRHTVRIYVKYARDNSENDNAIVVLK